MSKKTKKGTKGEAANYMTRSAALKRLKLSLKEFRKLCILKGVFPKEPKKKFKGQNKTYYLAKDIRFLGHEGLINKFRQINAFRKKIRKAKAKSMKFDYKDLKANIPQYTLTHIIKERYPRFIDSLNDLDDALSLINLFNILPTHEFHNINSELLENCKRLNREFMLYLALTQNLKRAFISIKGYYLNTEIMGVDIIWLVPFALPQKLPFDVDYSVMTSFLEVYMTLMKFVNYKIYKDNGIDYPPPTNMVDYPFYGYDSLTMNKVQSQIKEFVKKNSNDENENIKFLESEDLKKIEEKKQRMDKLRVLFKPYVFYISREVSKEVFGLAILSSGGVYGDDSSNSAFEEDDPRITHYIVDRPFESLDIKKNKEYIQPQWIFDCINSNSILSTDNYGPQRKITVADSKGVKQTVLSKLPPHVSPFYEHNVESEFKYEPIDINRPTTINVKTNKIQDIENISEKKIEKMTDEKLEKNINKEAEVLKEKLLSKKKQKLLERVREDNAKLIKKKKI